MTQQGDAPRPAATRRPLIYKDLTLIQLAAITIAADQFTKYLVQQLLSPGHSYPEQGFFRFTHTFNTGSAFGLFQNQNFPLILVAVVGITILVLIYRSQRWPTNMLRLSLGLQLGGGAGNLVDRIRLGHVTDFLDVGSWPVFNLADAAIVTGLVLLGWMFLRPRDRLHQESGVPERLQPEVVDEQKEPKDGYSYCPVCDGDMEAVSKGWRCSSCGVRESIDRAGQPSTSAASPELPDTLGASSSQPTAVGLDH